MIAPYLRLFLLFLLVPTVCLASDGVGIYRAIGYWALDSNRTFSYDPPADMQYSFSAGGSNDVPIVGDWNGDGRVKLGIYHNGFWLLDMNGNGVWDGAGVDRFIALGGNPGEIPVVGDWNGDGRTKVGFYYQGFWALDYNGNGQWDGPNGGDRFIALGGNAGEQPVVGDWNGDGRVKVGYFIPSSGVWALDYNGNGQWDGGDPAHGGDAYYVFGGGTGAKAVVGDWTAIHKTNIGTFNAGFWLLDLNGNGQWDGTSTDELIALGGNSGDVPVVGDWNGDGKTKAGVFLNGVWFIDFNGDGVWDSGDLQFNYGIQGDQPVVGAWEIIPLNLTDFRDCIGPNIGNHGYVCALQSGTYDIDGSATPTLLIERSNITVEGLWPYPTLRRNGAFSAPLIGTSSSASWVTIQNFVIDGNWQNGGSSGASVEVDLPNCSYCQVNSVEMDNSSKFALYLHHDSPTAVRWSSFSNNLLAGIYMDSGSCSNPSLWSPSVCQSIVNSTFTGNGGSGISFFSQNAQAVSNTLAGNTAHCPDPAPVGQIYVDSGSDAIVISNNTVEGALTCSNGYWGNGLELHGTNLTIANNTIKNNAGEGIYMESTQGVQITGDDIENNNQKGSGSDCRVGFPGIRLHTASTSRATANITINGVTSIGQAYGVQADSCDVGQFHGSAINNLTITNSCFAGNSNSGVGDFRNCGTSGHDSCLGSNYQNSNNQYSGICPGH